MNHCYIKLLASIFAFCAVYSYAEENSIRVNEYSDPNSKYVINQIKNALAHIDTQYKFEVLHENFTQAKTNEEVKNQGLLNLCWTTADADIESTLYPIRIPLLKGLLGYRIFIINKKNQTRFDQVNTLNDLKKFTFGQGKTWTDAKILESNGLTVIKTNKYPGLFYMVDGDRFDAFPRGVNEPFGELSQRPEMKDLTIEQQLMVSYKMPFYLFVSRDNPKLAHDLELGLNRAIADGSYDKIFYNDPGIRDVLEKADMKNRKVFYLDNPFLTKETPLDRKELWFDPKSAP